MSDNISSESPTDDGEIKQTSPSESDRRRNYRYFGARLCRARRRAGLTLKALSEMANVSSQALSKWEVGEVRSPSPITLKAVAVAIGLPEMQLFDWIEENEKMVREAHIARDINSIASERSLVAEYVEEAFPEANGEAENLQMVIDEIAPYRYFGARLCRARRRAGLTLRALSEVADVSLQSLSKWEVGEVRSPNPRTLRAVAAAIGLPETQLFDWIEENDRMLRGAAVARDLSPIGPKRVETNDDGPKEDDFKPKNKRPRSTKGIPTL